MSTTIKNGQPAGGDPVVTSTKKSKNKRSTFKLDYSNASTPMFGLCTPFWNEYGVPGDKWKVRSSHDLRSMNLSAPLMQNLIRHKFYTATPMRAILPRTWDFIYNNPVNGDDIDASAALPLFDFQRLVSNATSKLYALGDSDHNIPTTAPVGLTLTKLLAHYSILSGVLGPSALCKILGIVDISTGSASFSGGLNAIPSPTYNRPNEYLDKVFQAIQSMLGDISKKSNFYLYAYNGSKYTPISTTRPVRDYAAERDTSYQNLYLTLPEGVWSFIHWWQRNPCLLVWAGVAPNGPTPEDVPVSELGGTYTLPAFSISYVPSSRPLDISPLIAYQMSMAEFMTDSKIDAVYSAEMWRNQFDSLAHTADYPSMSFSRNGVQYDYDAFSAISLEIMLDKFLDIYSFTTDTDFFDWTYVFAFLDLFTLKGSLRYKDYFTGARKQPLAVGDVTAEVKSNAVSAVDITKSIQWQRFLNQVNRIGPKAKDYLQGIYGESPMPRADVPSYLCDVSETIGTQETENTGNDQLTDAQTTTAVFRSKGGKYMFEFSVKEECILLGISYYSLRQFYPRYMSWQSLNRKSRDDMFNPYFQHIGDQPISKFELGVWRFSMENDPSGTRDLPVFGYTTRDMQYKTRVDVCSGAFAPSQSLYAWLFVNDPHSWIAPQNVEINSEFLRYDPEELCRYYNVVPRSYHATESFDFIVIDHNFVSCSRNMSYNPQIL